jgi:hypothetical protein
MNKAIFPLGLLAAGAYLFTRGWNTAQGVQRLEYFNPRIKITKLSLTGADLQLQLDLRNPSSADIFLQYFYGNVNYLQNDVPTRIAGFTFSPTGTSALMIKARSTTTVPFTIRISSISAVSFITKLIKAIGSGTPVSTMLQVDGLMHAAGLDIPVKFNYDVKSNAISGIGRMETQSLLTEEIENYFQSMNSYNTQRHYKDAATDTAKFLQYTQSLVKSFKDVKITVAQNFIQFKYNNGKGVARIPVDPVRKEILLPKLKAIVKAANASVNGIGSVKATLEFSNNSALEKYFTGKRMDKKMIFSKN